MSRQAKRAAFYARSRAVRHLRPNWNPAEWLGDQHPELQRKLLEMRGGCRCCVSAPCPACVDPIDADEAEALGLVPHLERNEA